MTSSSFKIVAPRLASTLRKHDAGQMVCRQPDSSRSKILAESKLPCNPGPEIAEHQNQRSIRHLCMLTPCKSVALNAATEKVNVSWAILIGGDSHGPTSEMIISLKALERPPERSDFGSSNAGGCEETRSVWFCIHARRGSR